MKAKNLIPILILTLVLTPVVFADDGAPALTLTQIQDSYLREEIKTRADFKAYTDKKITDMQKYTDTTVKATVADIASRFDVNIHNMLQEALFKGTILMIASIVLGNAIWFFLKRKIDEMGKRARVLTDDQYALIVGSIISQDYKDSVTKANLEHAEIEKPLYKDDRQELRTPTVEEIEKMLDDNAVKAKVEAEYKKQNELAKKKRIAQEKIDKENLKKQEKIDKENAKMQAKIEKENLKRQKLIDEQNKKIDKIRREMKPTTPAPLPTIRELKEKDIQPPLYPVPPPRKPNEEVN